MTNELLLRQVLKQEGFVLACEADMRGWDIYGALVAWERHLVRRANATKVSGARAILSFGGSQPAAKMPKPASGKVSRSKKAAMA